MHPFTTSRSALADFQDHARPELRILAGLEQHAVANHRGEQDGLVMGRSPCSAIRSRAVLTTCRCRSSSSRPCGILRGDRHS